MLLDIVLLPIYALKVALLAIFSGTRTFRAKEGQGRGPYMQFMTKEIVFKLNTTWLLTVEVYRYGNFGFYRYRLYFCQNLPIPITNPILILHMSNNDSLHIPCI